MRIEIVNCRLCNIRFERVNRFSYKEVSLLKVKKLHAHAHMICTSCYKEGEKASELYYLYSEENIGKRLYKSLEGDKITGVAKLILIENKASYDVFIPVISVHNAMLLNKWFGGKQHFSSIPDEGTDSFINTMNIVFLSGDIAPFNDGGGLILSNDLV